MSGYIPVLGWWWVGGRTDTTTWVGSEGAVGGGEAIRAEPSSELWGGSQEQISV